MVDDLLQAIESFRASYREPTLTDAVSFALRAGAFAAGRGHRTVLVDSNPALASVMASLSSGDREHPAALDELARGRAIDGSVRAARKKPLPQRADRKLGRVDRRAAGSTRSRITSNGW